MISVVNDFTQYQLTADELAIGCYLSPEQRAVIQNDIAECAIKRAAIVHDITNPGKTLLEDAALKGQLTILQYMLYRSDSILNQTNQTEEN